VEYFISVITVVMTSRFSGPTRVEHLSTFHHAIRSESDHTGMSLFLRSLVAERTKTLEKLTAD